MNTPAERIMEERARLGMGVGQFATVGGVGRGAQANYEKGLRQPDLPYLAAIAAAGADVLYIITGTRALSEAQFQEEMRRYGDAWETLELALAKFDRTLSPEKKRKAADALYRASKQQTASQEQLTSLVLDLAA
jgi:transcriptional regulator with XRE-family HTH domain